MTTATSARIVLDSSKVDRIETIRKRVADRSYVAIQNGRIKAATEDADFLVSVAELSTNPEDVIAVQQVRSLRRNWRYDPSKSRTHFWAHASGLLKAVDRVKASATVQSSSTPAKMSVVHVHHRPGGVNVLYVNGKKIPGTNANATYYRNAFVEAGYIFEERVLTESRQLVNNDFPAKLSELEDHLKNMANSERAKKIADLEAQLAALKKDAAVAQK